MIDVKRRSHSGARIDDRPGGRYLAIPLGVQKTGCGTLEAFERLSQLTGTAMKYEYLERNRPGDHICYISNTARLQSHYSDWKITKSLDDIFRDNIDSWKARL
jgi:CDP-paratose 2-epimerase